MTHVDRSGSVRMVDVGDKPVTVRAAEAEGVVRMSREALDLVVHGTGPKGNVLTVAELAGTVAAKRTGDLIPLCHPLALDAVEVTAVPDESVPGVRVRARVRAEGRTGVEMEALTAVAVACLTVYDMIKAIDRGMTIDAVQLLSKTGGTRGEWRRG